MRQVERHGMDALRDVAALGSAATLAVVALSVFGMPAAAAGSAFHFVLSSAQHDVQAVNDPSVATRQATQSVREAFEAFRARAPISERRMSAEERQADLEPEFLDAILRIEGVFDPTRIGAFGPSLRMTVRSGTASMTNVFADRWRRADDDPNLHYRVRYLAQAWLAPPEPICENFRRFRPEDVAVALDQPTPADCVRVANRTADATFDTGALAITAAGTGIPVFAAPYPGSRFTPAALRALAEARLKAVEARAWFTNRPH